MDTIKLMARLKLNTLQMHFSEHLGFRIESKRFPQIVSNEHLSQDAQDVSSTMLMIIILTLFRPLIHQSSSSCIRSLPREFLMENTTMGLDITNPDARAFIKEIYDEMDDLFHTSTSFHMGADEFIDFGKYDEFPQLETYAKEHFGLRRKALIPLWTM